MLADVFMFLPPSLVEQDILASLPTLDITGLTTLFDDQLKTCLLSRPRTKDQDMSKLVMAVVRRETQLAGKTTIQDMVARMISSNVSSLVKSLAGCELLEICLKMFSDESKCLLQYSTAVRQQNSCCRCRCGSLDPLCSCQLSITWSTLPLSAPSLKGSDPPTLAVRSWGRWRSSW